MYEAFYGLNGKPFNLTPDPRFLYLSQKHKEAFAHLVYGVQNRSGFVMVTGEIGTGKTTICRSLLSQLDEETELAFIFNPILSPVELLRKINEEFGIETEAESVKGLIDELNEYLVDCASRGKNCVLVIDEAQTLEPKLLEQIRLLSNLETETQKLLQILLIGQPELLEILAMPELRQLNQRITARYHLKGLNPTETRQYIAFRLRVAGGLRKVRFTRGALRKIYRVSKGTPRVINAVSDRALLIGYTQESQIVTSKIVRRAAREVQGEKVRIRRWSKSRTGSGSRLIPRSAIAALLVIVAAIAVAATFDTVPRSWDEFIVGTEAALERWMPTPESRDGIRVADASAPPLEGGEAPIAPALAKTKPTVMAASVKDSTANATQPISIAPRDRPTGESIPAVAEQWPIRLEPQKAFGAALSAMLETWEIDAVGEVPEEDDAAAIAAFAAAHGLSSTFIQPTLNQLLTLNLPALTRIVTPNGGVWVALVGAESDSFNLSGDAGIQSVDRELFARHYAKEAAVLWRDPAPDTASIVPWTSSPAVETMQGDLAALGFIDEADATYDREVIDVVKRIQYATGLTVDGIVGPQTRLLISHWRDPSTMPTLGDGSPTSLILQRAFGIGSSPGEQSPERMAERLPDTPPAGELAPEPPSAKLGNEGLPDWIKLPGMGEVENDDAPSTSDDETDS